MLRALEFGIVPSAEIASMPFVFTDLKSTTADFPKLAVLSFKASAELAGRSVSECFATELLRTFKYDLVERSEIEKVLEERGQKPGGVAEDSVAIEVGKALGVRGVVVGTVSEYDLRQAGRATVPCVGISVRMIDTLSGQIIWSVQHSRAGESVQTLSEHAGNIVREAMAALSMAWMGNGDTGAKGLPAPEPGECEGVTRKAVLRWKACGQSLVVGYEVHRSAEKDGDYDVVGFVRNTGEGPMVFTDTGLEHAERYFYRIRAANPYGFVGPFCEPFEITTSGYPHPPKDLAATSEELRKTHLTWSLPRDSYIKGYVIYRAREGGKPVDIVKIEDRGKTWYVDAGFKGRGLADGTAYQYAIAAVNNRGAAGVPSAAVTVKTRPVPAAVSLEAASGLFRKIDLRWSRSAEKDVAGYILESAADAEGPFAGLFKTSDPLRCTFVDGSKLGEGMTRYYRVCAYNAVGARGEFSEIVRATTKKRPARVAGVSASLKKAGQIVLEWLPNGEKDIVGYNIYRTDRHDGKFAKIAMVDGSESSFTEGELGPFVTFWYRVQAVDSDGLVSDPSESVEGLTKALPPVPIKPVAVIDGGSATIEWEARDDDRVATYRVYGKRFFGWKLLNEAKASVFNAGELRRGKGYRFAVSSVCVDGLESPKVEVRVAWPRQ